MLTFVLVQELFGENGDVEGGEAIAVPTLGQDRWQCLGRIQTPSGASLNHSDCSPFNNIPTVWLPLLCSHRMDEGCSLP